MAFLQPIAWRKIASQQKTSSRNVQTSMCRRPLCAKVLPEHQRKRLINAQKASFCTSLRLLPSGKGAWWDTSLKLSVVRWCCQRSAFLHRIEKEATHTPGHNNNPNRGKKGLPAPVLIRRNRQLRLTQHNHKFELTLALTATIICCQTS